MITKLVTAPAVEPVTLAEAKAHLRVDITDDDTLISSLITSARQYIERAIRRALVTQTWRASIDEFPASGEIVLPKPPLQSVTSIQYTDINDSTSTIASSTYTVDTDSEPGRIVLKYGQSWPSTSLANTNPVQVTFVAGYGAAADVPAHFKQAILLLAGHWYENREAIAVTGAIPKEMPLAVSSLIGLDRVW